MFLCEQFEKDVEAKQSTKADEGCHIKISVIFHLVDLVFWQQMIWVSRWIRIWFEQTPTPLYPNP